MRRLLSMALCVGSVVALAACGAAPSPGAAEGMLVTARLPVLVTNEPLGDVVQGALEPGDAATAVCFVPVAQTNTGATGAAVMIQSSRLTGYAAVTDFPEAAEDRAMVFDADDTELEEALPSC